MLRLGFTPECGSSQCFRWKVLVYAFGFSLIIFTTVICILVCWGFWLFFWFLVVCLLGFFLVFGFFFAYTCGKGDLNPESLIFCRESLSFQGKWSTCQLGGPWEHHIQSQGWRLSMSNHLYYATCILVFFRILIRRGKPGGCQLYLCKCTFSAISLCSQWTFSSALHCMQVTYEHLLTA